MMAAGSRDERHATPEYDVGAAMSAVDDARSPATQHRQAGKRSREDTPEYDEGDRTHKDTGTCDTPAAAIRPGMEDDKKGPATQPTNRKKVVPRMSVGSFYGPGISGAIAKIRETSLKLRCEWTPLLCLFHNSTHPNNHDMA